MQLLFMLSNVYDVFHILIYIVRFGFPNLMMGCQAAEPSWNDPMEVEKDGARARRSARLDVTAGHILQRGSGRTHSMSYTRIIYPQTAPGFSIPFSSLLKSELSQN